MWWYTLGVLALWVVNPEIRRFYDLIFGFSKVEILAVLPILSLLPHAWSLTFDGGWRRLPPVLMYAAWIWIGGFAYALVTAIMSGNSLSGAYEVLTFILPIGLGLWVAADATPFAISYKRLTTILFALATFTSIYGVIQYAIAPVWDVNWLKEVIKGGTVSFGQPYPFQIRVFSTLNDPGSFALFLAAVLLMALPELSMRRPLLLLQIPIWIVAFGLTLVRTGWLMFAFGTIAYLLLSPRRVSLITTVVVAAAVVVGLATVLPAVVGNDAVITSLTDRFATLSDLDEDTSRKERQELYISAPQVVLATPFGTGVGVLGASTKLTSSQATTDFDSGYLGRAIEMGLPGLVLYMIPQGIFLFASLKLWTQARKNHDAKLQSIAGVALAMLIALLFLQFAHDANGFPMVTFWLVECLAISALAPERGRIRALAHA